MDTRRPLLAITFFSLLGCAAAAERLEVLPRPTPADPPDRRAVGLPPFVSLPSVDHRRPSLSECLRRSDSRLVEIGRINNNDQVDHGTIQSITTSPTDSRLLVVSSDGNAKLWRGEELLGTARGFVFTYGPELSAQVLQAEFAGDRLLFGNTQGLVTAWSVFVDERETYLLSEGPIAGGEPGVAVRALAVRPAVDASESGALVANVTGDFLQVTHETDGATWTATLDFEARDAVFREDGSLAIAGVREDRAIVSVRRVDESLAEVRRWELPSGGKVDSRALTGLVEIETVGDALVVRDQDEVIVGLDALLSTAVRLSPAYFGAVPVRYAPVDDELVLIAHSVTASASGPHTNFTVASADHSEEHNTGFARDIAVSLPISDAVDVGVDRGAGVVHVASRGGTITALRCE